MINIYNIDETSKQFLSQAWQLEHYHEVLELIDSYPNRDHPKLRWLISVAARGGDDIGDVSEARSILHEFML